jgi:hypothetical protein
MKGGAMRKKLVEIDCPIRCPYYSERYCRYLRMECHWHQGMKTDAFPDNCPFPDAPQDMIANIPLTGRYKK